MAFATSRFENWAVRSSPQGYVLVTKDGVSSDELSSSQVQRLESNPSMVPILEISQDEDLVTIDVVDQRRLVSLRVFVKLNPRGFQNVLQRLEPELQSQLKAWANLVVNPEQYVVSAIKAKRGTGSALEYLVAWKDFDEPTWEPGGRLFEAIPDLVDEFEMGEKSKTPFSMAKKKAKRLLHRQNGAQKLMSMLIQNHIASELGSVPVEVPLLCNLIQTHVSESIAITPIHFTQLLHLMLQPSISNEHAMRIGTLLTDVQLLHPVNQTQLAWSFGVPIVVKQGDVDMKVDEIVFEDSTQWIMDEDQHKRDRAVAVFAILNRAIHLQSQADFGLKKFAMFVARNKAKFMKMPSQLVQSIRDADIEVATALGSFLSTVLCHLDADARDGILRELCSQVDSVEPFHLGLLSLLLSSEAAAMMGEATIIMTCRIPQTAKHYLNLPMTKDKLRHLLLHAVPYSSTETSLERFLQLLFLVVVRLRELKLPQLIRSPQPDLDPEIQRDIDSFYERFAQHRTLLPRVDAIAQTTIQLFS
eukprot:m.73961 g.73961  ORF g.73961 m.73961 type:complete len:530 (+) comp12384_c0_seq1:223-1812(+)